jgi:uncharacterized protein (TIGR04552 family)
VINFVADLPVRIDQFLCRVPGAENDLGAVIFVLTEFQVMDAETARANEAGENSHVKYKARQHDRVKARLAEGESKSAVSHPPSAIPDSDSDSDD